MIDWFIDLFIDWFIFFAEKVSDKDIQDVVFKANLDYNKLENLFAELEITASEIDKERRNAKTDDYQIQARFVLRFWRETKGNLATRRRILDALDEYSYKDAKDFLTGKWGK